MSLQGSVAAGCVVVDGEGSQFSPTGCSSSVSGSASCLSTGLFSVEVCGWGLSYVSKK